MAEPLRPVRPVRDPLAIWALVIACLALVASGLREYLSWRRRRSPAGEASGVAEPIPSPPAPAPMGSSDAAGAPVEGTLALPVERPFGAAEEVPDSEPEPRPADSESIRAFGSTDAHAAEGSGPISDPQGREAEVRERLDALEARLDQQRDVVNELRAEVESLEQTCEQIPVLQQDLAGLRYTLSVRSPLDDLADGEALAGPGARHAVDGQEIPPDPGVSSETEARAGVSLKLEPDAIPDEVSPVWVQRCPATAGVLDAIESFTELFSMVAEAVGDAPSILGALWSGPDATELGTEHRLLLAIEMAAGSLDATLLGDLRTIATGERRVPGPDPLRRWTPALDSDERWRELAITWLQRRGPVLQALVEALPVEGLVGSAPTAVEATRALTMRLAALTEPTDAPAAIQPLQPLSDRMHRSFEQLARAGGRRYVAVCLYRDSVERLEHGSEDGPRPKLERFIAYAEIDRLPDTSPPLPWPVDFARGVVVRVVRPIFADDGGRPGRVFFVPPRLRGEGGPDAAA